MSKNYKGSEGGKMTKIVSESVRKGLSESLCLCVSESICKLVNIRVTFSVFELVNDIGSG